MHVDRALRAKACSTLRTSARACGIRWWVCYPKQSRSSSSLRNKGSLLLQARGTTRRPDDFHSAHAPHSQTLSRRHRSDRFVSQALLRARTLQLDWLPAFSSLLLVLDGRAQPADARTPASRPHPARLTESRSHLAFALGTRRTGPPPFVPKAALPSRTRARARERARNLRKRRIGQGHGHGHGHGRRAFSDEN